MDISIWIKYEEEKKKIQGSNNYEEKLKEIIERLRV